MRVLFSISVLPILTISGFVLGVYMSAILEIHEKVNVFTIATGLGFFVPILGGYFLLKLYNKASPNIQRALSALSILFSALAFVLFMEVTGH